MSPRAATDGGDGVALEKVGDFDQPLYVTQPPADPERPLRGRAVRHDSARPGRRRRAEPVPRHLRPGHLRGRAGAALDRLRARLRGLGPVLRRLHRPRTRTRAWSSTARSADDPATADPDQRPRAADDRRLRPQPQRRPAALRPRRPALHRHRRRRRSPATPSARPRTSAACSARSCGSTRASGREPYSSPATTRSPTSRARGPRSTPTGCATRGASPSTARPATCGSATSARTRSRRSTRCPPARSSTAPTSAGRRSRGPTRFNDDQEAPGRDRRRCSTTATRAAARSPAATSCATASSTALYGRYLYGDFCAGELRSFTADAGRAGDGRPRASASRSRR